MIAWRLIKLLHAFDRRRLLQRLGQDHVFVEELIEVGLQGGQLVIGRRFRIGMRMGMGIGLGHGGVPHDRKGRS